MPRHFGCLMLTFFLWHVHEHAHAEIITLPPVVDISAIDANEPGTIHDGIFDGFVADGEDTQVRAFDGLNIEFEMRGAIEFRIDGVPLTSTVEVAMLFLQTTTRAQPAELENGEIFFHGYAGNGVAELADFSAENLIAARPANLPLELTPLVIDVTDFLRTLHGARVSHAGFVMRASPAVTYHVASNEHQFEPWRPRLEIRYSPIPEVASGFLMLTGVGCSGLMFARHRRRPRPGRERSGRLLG